uniref:Variant surface glycoprotein 1125.1013 n=1 Tax=Trypanosoma brucei TaxID=5691 RepID=M4SX54_9TRYP|nr:variant surface glycoprotein 403 [Trypanosoma brucei]APD73298.1 variant surface glycoprotein 1125.1013 [Trypanosoma brucei]
MTDGSLRGARCALLLLLHPENLISADNTDAAAKTVTDRFSEAKYIKALAMHALTGARSHDAAIDNLKTHVSAWQLAAAAAKDRNKQIGFLLLQEKGARSLKEATKDAEDLKQKTAQLVEVLNRRYGAVMALLKAKQTVTTPATNPPQKYSSEAQCQQILTGTATGADHCDVKEVTTDGPSPAAKLDLGKTKALKLLATQDLKPDDITIKTYVKGTLGTINQAYENGKCKDSGGGNSHFIKIEVEAAKAPAPGRVAETPLYDSSSNSDKCKEVQNKEQKTHMDNDIVAASLCNYKSAKRPAPLNPADLSESTITADEESLRQAATLLPSVGAAPTLNDAQKKQELKNKLKEIYGTESKDMQRDFVTALQTLSGTYHGGTKYHSDKIINIAKNSNTNKALIWLTAQKAETKDAIAPQSATNKGEECKIHKPKKNAKRMVANGKERLTRKAHANLKMEKDRQTQQQGQQKELQENKRKKRNAKGKTRKIAKMAANGMEKNAKIPVFSSTRNLLSWLLLL